MPTHLYCLLAAGSDTAAPADVGVEVRVLAVGGIVAWVSTTSDVQLTREGRRAAAEAVRHDRVIARALARNLTPVPATLTDPYASDADLSADVAARTTEIGDALARVAGLVEMAVILAPGTASADPTTDDSPGGPGRKYLERRRDLPARLNAVADRIDQGLRPVSVASTRRTDKDRVGLSHLVRRGDVDRYRSVALGFVSEGQRMVVDGPRAPYSFAAFAPKRGPGQ